MATANKNETSGTTFKGYVEKIALQVAEAKATLALLEAKADEKGAQAEIAAIKRLKAARQHLDQKVQGLTTTHESLLGRARADIDEGLSTFKASMDALAAKVKTRAGGTAHD
jgi:hypothetical protein